MAEHPVGVGVSEVAWDNIAQEWVAYCTCGEMFNGRLLEDVGRTFDNHVADETQGGRLASDE